MPKLNDGNSITTQDNFEAGICDVNVAQGGYLTLDVWAPTGGGWNGATATWQYQPPGADSAIWIDVPDGAFTADGSVNLQLSTRKVRLVTSVADPTGIRAQVNN